MFQSISNEKMFKITGGTKRGLKINTPKGHDVTRPATGKLKKAIFDIIGGEIENTTVLDLYSGTGALGIEALSRGAASVTFVDRSSEAKKIINENCKLCGFGNMVMIHNSDVYDFVKSVCEKELQKYDFIFVDPPYNDLPQDIFFCSLVDMLKPLGVIFCESRLKDEYLNSGSTKYDFSVRRYGGTKLSLITKKGE